MRPHIGAGNVHLDRLGHTAPIDTANEILELLDIFSFDRDYDRAAKLAKDRNLRLEETLQAGVLDPDRIEHSRRGLDHPRGRVTHARVARHGLRDDSTDRVEIHERL